MPRHATFSDLNTGWAVGHEGSVWRLDSFCTTTDECLPGFECIERSCDVPLDYVDPPIRNVGQADDQHSLGLKY